MPITRASCLFKYMKSKHAHRLMTEGMIRIGTLFEYRDTETHGSKIGDEDEGTKSSTIHVPNYRLNAEKPVPDSMKKMFSLTGEGSLTVTNGKISSITQSDDLFIYSASEDFNPLLLTEFNADACVRIDDADAFFRTISSRLRSLAQFRGVHRCVYMPRDVPRSGTHDIHPSIMKDERYSTQREYRAIWEPKRGAIKPIILKCPTLIKYCSRFA